MTDMTSLFLSQSYQDGWDDYKRSLTKEDFITWNYVILTASNERQADGYRAQISERQRVGLLPKGSHFAVIPDRDGKRVGSGGATLSVIKYIAEREEKTDFSGLRILVIHSGGDSKRVPQYSALGKLFSPVPHELPDGRSSTLFDEFMISMSSVPSRFREGMLLLSGDVLLLFNPLQIDYSGNGAAAISFKEDVETGKNHGVFLRGENGNVARFLHKQSVESLREVGAVNDRNCVDIDTGAVIFSKDMLRSLYGLISSEDGYNKFVNDTVRLSLYGDFLYPLASDSTLEKYFLEKPEGSYSDELTEARKAVWNALRPYRLKLLRIAPAKFIHFGTTKEILGLMSSGIEAYKNLGWSRQVNSGITGDVAGYNSLLSDGASIGENCYLEVSYVHHGAKIGSNVLLSYVDIYDETVPDNVVLHGLKLNDGRYTVRIYGINDDPKSNMLFGNKLDEPLWNAKIYPICDTMREAVRAALEIYNGGEVEDGISLSDGFNSADSDWIISYGKEMQELVRMNKLHEFINAQRPASEVKGMIDAKELTPIQKDWLDRRLKRSGFGQTMRLDYYIGTALGGSEGDKYISNCFKTISGTILNAALEHIRYNDSCKISKDNVIVKLPLRVNWGGGWSDTPPYCIENGGTVLNAAITLNGALPVEVSLEKIPEHKIIFDSRDMDVHGEFDTIEKLQDTGDPYDPFALQKAGLLACGIIPREGGDLGKILDRLGGGFIMRSEVMGVPKGSGLGTSSILSGACVKALLEFTGIRYTEDELYSRVLCMEQIMSTGGGWQDQVGGLTNGIKYISSKPGADQQIKVEHIEISEDTRKELNDRFALIYTGQRRLARNLLRDVVGRYVGNEPESIYSLNEIRRVAALMRFELERGNVDGFAKLLDKHWELSKMVDKGSSNTLIEQIFTTIDDLIDGQLVCGAGGGGFLQVVLKKNVTKQQVHQRLKEVFQDADVDVWNCEIL